METPGPHPNLQLGRGGRSKAKKGRSPGKGGERFSEPASYSRSSLALGGHSVTQTASTPPPAAPCDSCPPLTRLAAERARGHGPRGADSGRCLKRA